jgi:hypothetical protein
MVICIALLWCPGRDGDCDRDELVTNEKAGTYIRSGNVPYYLHLRCQLTQPQVDSFDLVTCSTVGRKRRRRRRRRRHEVAVSAFAALLLSWKLRLASDASALAMPSFLHTLYVPTYCTVVQY